MALEIEVRVGAVLLRERRLGKRPGNGEVRIVPANAPLGAGTERLGHEVRDDGVRLQGLVGVPNPLGDIDNLGARPPKLHGDPLTARLGLAAQVHQHFEQCAIDALYHLHLTRRANLVVDSSKSASHLVHHHVTLLDVTLESLVLQRLPAEGARERATVIDVGVELHAVDAGQASLAEFHRLSGPRRGCAHFAIGW